MNVFLRRNLFFLIFLIFLIPYEGKAQNLQEVDLTFTAVQGETTIYSFTSVPIPPYIQIYPSHGTVDLVELSNIDYELHYTPDNGSLEDDYIRLIYTQLNGPAPQMFAVNITVDVIPSQVIAFDDFGTTPVNTPISIDVLANDSTNTTSGILSIHSMPVVNNGSVSYNAGSPFVNFTPRADFEGLTHFSYVVCNDQGRCDEATVSVMVMGDNAIDTDTMRIFTNKNVTKNVFVPNDYSLVTPPNNGIFSWNQDIPTYKPNLDYTGMDYIYFEKNGHSKVVEIFVLDYVANVNVEDDNIYTTSYAPVEFNVLENDEYGIGGGCFTLLSNPQYGTIEQTVPNGNLIYTPTPGFNGIDEFAYSVSDPQCDGDAEEGRVIIHVSNFEPNATKYTLSTPKKTPLIIGYNVPIKEFNFEIVDQGQLGDVFFMDGQQDTVLYGQTISGYNLIVYNPDPNVTEGLDQFEIKYCVVDDGACAFEMAIKIDMQILDIGDGNGPQCFDDCIWSGDTNFDGIVNMQDLLPLGVGMGKMGVPRSSVDLTEWYGQYGDDWAIDFKEDEINFKHLDTDGDSLITALDTFSISTFYGNTHSLAPNIKPYYGFQINLDGNIYVEPGEEIELKMSIGSYDEPVQGIYGFTFPFNYSPDFFVPESVDIEFSSGSWLTYNSAVLQMQKNFNNGFAEAGFTRTDGNKIGGFGQIGGVKLVVTDDIDGFRDDDGVLSTTIGGGSLIAYDANGNPFQVSVEEFTIYIVLPKEDDIVEGADPLSFLKVFPNPASDELNVQMDNDMTFSQVMINSITGQQLYAIDGEEMEQHTMDVSNLENGVYIITVFTKEGVLNKKFEILR